MKDSKGLVSAFMAIGLTLALILGVVVWKMSAPSPAPDSSSQALAAEQDQETDHEAEEATPSSASESKKLEAAEDEAGAKSGSDQGQTYANEDMGAPSGDSGGIGSQSIAPRTDDPLLPPNAVVKTPSRRAAPTEVYRPSNIVPNTVAPREAPEQYPMQSPQSADRSEAPAPQVTSEPTPPAQQPTEPTQPIQPTEPTQTTPTPPALPEDGLQDAPETLPSLPAPETLAPLEEQTVPDNPAAWWNQIRGYFN